MYFSKSSQNHLYLLRKKFSLNFNRYPWKICCLMKMGFKEECVAPVSIRICLDFPLILILVSTWLLQVISGSRLEEGPWKSHEFGGRPSMGIPSLKNLHRIFEDHFFFFLPVSQLIRNDYKWLQMIFGPLFWWWTSRKMLCGRSRCYFLLGL